LILYGINTGLLYLGSPVIYVGVVQASLLNRLKASDTVANLPLTFYLALAVTPLLVAWYYPYVSHLKRIIVSGFAITAASSAAVPAVLLLDTPDWLKIFVVLLQGAVMGAAVTVAVTFMWEVLGRGVAEARRRASLALAFGVGPILAVLASLGSQLLLKGTMGPWDLPGVGQVGPITLPGMEYPWNFASLFAACTPIMALAAFLSSRFVIPLPAHELTRQPFLAGVFGCIGDFFRNRVLCLAAVVTILIYAGTQIISNLTLYTETALGTPPEQSAGFQNAARFTCKTAAGLFLGWLLTRTNPKAGMLVTSACALLAVVWAMFVPGTWFLLSFGLLGMGELYGVYGPNYILSASPKAHMRRNMSFSTMWPCRPLRPARFLAPSLICTVANLGLWDFR
jgi:hypothetical protein